MTPPFSPLVKMELGKLEKDPRSKKAAMSTLKGYVEQLDTDTVPFFLDQVRESKEAMKYSISLFEVLARTEGRNIIFHVPKIINTIVKTLSTLGLSSHQQACVRVLRSIVDYGILALENEAQQEGVLRALCNPLLDSMIGKTQPLADGAAVCLQGLVESQGWRFAASDMINELCVRATNSLKDNVTQTVPYLYLICSITKCNGAFLQQFGKSLLKSAFALLSSGVTTDDWQKKFYAVEMIDSLLKYVDCELKEFEIRDISETLEKCRGDNIHVVQQAVTKALDTVSRLTPHKNSDCGSCNENCSPQFQRPLLHKSSVRRNIWGNLDSIETTPQRCSPESMNVSFPQSSATISHSPLNWPLDDKPFSPSCLRKPRFFDDDEEEDADVSVSVKDGVIPFNSGDHYSEVGSNEGTPETVKNEEFLGFVQLASMQEEEARNLLEEDTQLLENSPQGAEVEDTCQDSNSQEPQIPQRSPFTDDYKMFDSYVTPSKLIRTLQLDSSPETAGKAVELCDKSETCCKEQEDESVAENICTDSSSNQPEPSTVDNNMALNANKSEMEEVLGAPNQMEEALRTPPCPIVQVDEKLKETPNVGGKSLSSGKRKESVGSNSDFADRKYSSAAHKYTSRRLSITPRNLEEECLRDEADSSAVKETIVEQEAESKQIQTLNEQEAESKQTQTLNDKDVEVAKEVETEEVKNSTRKDVRVAKEVPLAKNVEGEAREREQLLEVQNINQTLVSVKAQNSSSLRRKRTFISFIMKALVFLILFFMIVLLVLKSIYVEDDYYGEIPT